MILLYKNTINNVCLTLSESTTLTGSSYYLFRFINENNFNELLFTGEDISNNKDRFNQFLITETGSTFTNLTASTIHLNTPGYYKYEVYQMTGQTNLSLSGVTGGPIEYGKVYLSGATIDAVKYTYSGRSDFYVYNL